MSLNQSYEIHVDDDSKDVYVTDLIRARVTRTCTNALSSFSMIVPNSSKYNSAPFSLHATIYMRFAQEDETASQDLFRGRIESMRI